MFTGFSDTFMLTLASSYGSTRSLPSIPKARCGLHQKAMFCAVSNVSTLVLLVSPRCRSKFTSRPLTTKVKVLW